MQRDDYADRAYIASEQAGLRCETPPSSGVPMVRHHPEVLRRQQVAQRHASGRGPATTAVVLGMAAAVYAGLWLIVTN